MSKFIVEIGGQVEETILKGAKNSGINAEKFIAEILNKYVISEHIMENEEIALAYEECGNINLDWANL